MQHQPTDFLLNPVLNINCMSVNYVITHVMVYN